MCYNCVVLVSIVCYTRENLVIERMPTLSAHPPTDDHSPLCSLTLYSSLEDAKILFSKFVKWGWRFFSLFNFFEKEKLNLRNFFGSKLNLKIENQRIKSSKVSKQKRKRVFCCLHCVVISVFKNKSKFSFQTRKEHKGNCPHTRWGVDSINVSSHVKFSQLYNLITPDITTSYNQKVQPLKIVSKTF